MPPKRSKGALKSGGGAAIAPPLPIRDCLTAEEKKSIRKFITYNWNGEDPSSRVSERVRHLDTDLFIGATLLDDCARSSNQRLVVYGFRLYLKAAFPLLLNQVRHFKLCEDEALLQSWINFTVKGDDGRKKTTESFWTSNFYQDRNDEHLRLKTSLHHPSHHYTFRALRHSWLGERSHMGPFGTFYEEEVLHNTNSNTSSVFGISTAW